MSTFVAHDEEDNEDRVLHLEEHPSGSLWLFIDTAIGDGERQEVGFLVHPRDVLRLETWLAVRRATRD